jgi:hypothetical protein
MNRGGPILMKILVGGALLAASTAAYAAGSTVIPEPTDLVLFSMGVLGLVIGRRVARKRPPQD